MEREGYIERKFGIKRQRIRISERGVEILNNQYLLYKRIFECRDRIYISGKVVSGMGEGKYYTSLRGYVTQFVKKLGFSPVPGTLNIEVEVTDRSKLYTLKSCRGIEIKPFSNQSRSFGGAKCFLAEIRGKRAAVIIPNRTHYSSTIELISEHHLRKELKLNDGDKVEVVVFLGERT